VSKVDTSVEDVSKVELTYIYVYMYIYMYVYVYVYIYRAYRAYICSIYRIYHGIAYTYIAYI
jgi:hypothetical protein